jgi:hypothetical protein
MGSTCGVRNGKSTHEKFMQGMEKSWESEDTMDLAWAVLCIAGYGSNSL